MAHFFLTMGVGLVAGAGHVITGPDHLAAIAPVAAHQPKKATLLGFKWGLGHGLGACTLGLLALAARDLVDIEGISAWSEFLVGFMLIGVGIWGFRVAARTVIHSHHHDHDGSAHAHLHVHNPDHAHEVSEPQAEAESDTDPAPVPHHHRHGALYLGVLHGAAGMGHILAVVPSLALPPAYAALYLLCYFISAIVAMTAFGFGFGFLARQISGSSIKGFMYATSGAAVLIGTLWVATTWPGSGHGHTHFFDPHPYLQEGGQPHHHDGHHHHHHDDGHHHHHH